MLGTVEVGSDRISLGVQDEFYSALLELVGVLDVPLGFSFSSILTSINPRRITAKNRMHFMRG